MSAKHTPGPWWTTEYGIRDSGGYICHTHGAQHYRGQDERYEKEVEERQANKDLIAAAPELLEALKDAYPYIDNDALRTSIGDLIAKAEGITP